MPVQLHFPQKYSVLLFQFSSCFFPFLSGGQGLEAADATATLADSGIASSGLHPSLSWQGSAPGVQSFSGQPGPGHLQHMPREGATQHTQPAPVSACETFLLQF